ncbi:hypothetical protein K443DRAFT_682748, partial [Laccaria amethystina LaAM-08-1]
MNLGASSTYLSSNGTVSTSGDEFVWNPSTSTIHGDLHASESTNEMDAKFAFQLATRRNIALVGDPPLTSFGESKEWTIIILLAWSSMLQSGVRMTGTEDVTFKSDGH